MNLIEILEESVRGKAYTMDDFYVAADAILKAKECCDKESPYYSALSIAFNWLSAKRKILFMKRLGLDYDDYDEEVRNLL